MKEKVLEWRERNYECEYATLSEIMNYNLMEDDAGNKTLRYLRKAQFEALETYWYLRLVEKTPHVFELYKKLYTDKLELLKALGIPTNENITGLLANKGFGGVIEAIRTDDDFVKENRLQTVRESLTLDYPSYILALAMGSGKTVLIGSIIATEFALALEYGDSFVKNALIFAPGKTILGALKEMSNIPYEKILPPRLYKQFLSSVKITYTQDKEKDIPIIRCSVYNIVVTNTEKIRIQKPTTGGMQFSLRNLKEVEKLKEQEEIANLRLQTIASLPNLAIFSDEAHHTYGQSLETELKKVRKTVNYLAENTNVIVVVNTTGTPYFKKQMLRDVIYWYGLSQGIKDGILKEVKDSIYSYDEVELEEFLNTILEDFIKNYKNVKLSDGTPSKLAIYFPQTDDVDDVKPHVDKKVAELGLDPSVVLPVNNNSEKTIKDYFNNRINEIHNPYRIYLLVNMGTEGWNCPSLFATALARKLRSSNNFVLQAASRCLRQIPDNKTKARIYLSKDNVAVLDGQLKETFGEDLQAINQTKQDMRTTRIVLRKSKIEPLIVKQKIKRVILDKKAKQDISLRIPKVEKKEIKKTVYDAKETNDRKGILSETKVERLILNGDYCDIYEASVDLSSIYNLNVSSIYENLLAIYPDGTVPYTHMIKLKEQIENQLCNYKIEEEEVERTLALIKPDGFDKDEADGNIVYTAEIMYHKDKEDLLLKYEDYRTRDKDDISFHYSPYKMDSHPEKYFFDTLLDRLNENPSNVEDIYFMGAITDPKKTDFLFEYMDKKGKWHTHTPDFFIRKKDGKVLVVEIKGEVFRDLNKEATMHSLEELNIDKFKYEILFQKKKEEPYFDFTEFQKIVQVIMNGG